MVISVRFTVFALYFPARLLFAYRRGKCLVTKRYEGREHEPARNATIPSCSYTLAFGYSTQAPRNTVHLSRFLRQSGSQKSRSPQSRASLVVCARVAKVGTASHDTREEKTGSKGAIAFPLKNDPGVFCIPTIKPPTGRMYHRGSTCYCQENTPKRHAGARRNETGPGFIVGEMAPQIH